MYVNQADYDAMREAQARTGQELRALRKERDALKAHSAYQDARLKVFVREADAARKEKEPLARIAGAGH